MFSQNKTKQNFAFLAGLGKSVPPKKHTNMAENLWKDQQLKPDKRFQKLGLLYVWTSLNRRTANNSTHPTTVIAPKHETRLQKFGRNHLCNHRLMAKRNGTDAESRESRKLWLQFLFYIIVCDVDILDDLIYTHLRK